MKLKLKKSDLKRFGIDLLFIVAGCSVSAVCIMGILIPNGLTSGGVTGIVRVIQEVFDVGFSIVYYAFALVILIFCAILLGLREARKIVMMSVIYPAVLFIFEHTEFSLLEEKDLFLAAIYCGVLFGISQGLIFTRGFSFGGTDTVAKIIQKKLLPHISISKILLVIDACIIIGSGFMFGRNIALYALITQVIFSKTVDIVMFGFESKLVQLEIITSKHDEVVEYILNDIKRGVTNLKVSGAYTKTAREKIVTICSPRDSMMIKKFVSKADKDAFVTVIQVGTVWGKGEGFADILEE
ncbi:MAG: YitT family protein [Bacteroidaceae bacterium]|nr:YitT family protein [Bacteroidaceae bacterium]